MDRPDKRGGRGSGKKRIGLRLVRPVGAGRRTGEQDNGMSSEADGGREMAAVTETEQFVRDEIQGRATEERMERE